MKAASGGRAASPTSARARRASTSWAHSPRRACELDISDTGVKVEQEGSLPKFVPSVREISFNGHLARERGQQVRYITDRAVFELADDGLVLTELAPGIDLERDVLAQMGFRPRIADDCRTTDERVYAAGAMGLAADFAREAGNG